ncbi:DUF397 domain-containing protein [Streptomyces sp. URMC 124]|uniref:DUF397 domain-containing protein n=1 Tax=Streptomyces sp. URMC 124 TaxID=3423405 RepID=UPI003F19BE0D
MSTELIWRKSSHSGTTAGDCVEVAAVPHAVHIRDSKHPGPRITVPATSWSRFVGYAAAG